MNKEQDIENLFSKKFERFEVKTSDEEWSILSSKLGRSNFLKFSFTTFNVFYLLALLTFAGTATFTSFSSHRLTKKVKQLEQTIETYQKGNPVMTLPVTPLDSVRTNPTDIQINKSNTQKVIHTVPTIKNNPGLQGKNANIDIAKPSNITSAIKDTSQKINTNPVQADTSKNHTIKKVKKTVTIKKDKVVVKDTVVITKPKK